MKPSLNILIAGGTGFIGQALIADRLKRGDKVIVLGRNQSKIQHCFSNRVTAVKWTDLTKETLANCDLIINLAGENIGAKAWTTKRKQAILESRVNTTKKLANLCATLGKNAPTLFNASAIGIYPLQPIDQPSLNTQLTENTSLDKLKPSEFLNKVGIQWEQATNAARTAGIRVVNLRFAIVLSMKGGMLKKLLPFFRLGLGQKIGSGKQIISWISLQDLLQIIQFLIEHDKINGPVNIASPTPIQQQQFAKLFAQHLHRPCWLSLPTFVIKILFKQMGEELLLRGQAIYPSVLLNHHYSFLTPTLTDFLAKENNKL